MDYSPYYFNRRSPVPDKRTEKSGKAELILVFVIIASLIVTLVIVNVYGGSTILNALKGGLKKEDETTCYMVCLGGYEDKDEAESTARATRLAYAAGYVLSENNLYYVALATYFSKDEADTVSKKNDGTLIKKVTIKRNASNKGEYYVSGVLLNAAEKLNAAQAAYARKELTPQDTLTELEQVRTALLNAKQEIYSTYPNSPNLLPPLDSLLTFLTNILEERRADNILAEIRYAVCMAVFSSQASQ